MRRAAALNIAKAWLLLAILAAFLGAIGWALGGYSTASIFSSRSSISGRDRGMSSRSRSASSSKSGNVNGTTLVLVSGFLHRPD